MQCDAVLRELSNYIDGAVSPDLHRRMKDHFQGCESCTTMLESTRSVVQALNDDRLIDVPPGYSERLYHKLNAQLEGSAVLYSRRRRIQRSPSASPMTRLN